MEAKRTSVKEAKHSRLTKTPAAIMGPRLVFIAAVVVLCAFGLVMVYSASSILAMSSADYNNDPAYFLSRQAVFLAVGVVICLVLTALPYKWWGNPVFIGIIWVGTCGVLAMTAFGMGVSALGAERSIVIGGFALQPAEFAKITVILAAAGIFELQRTRSWHPVAFVAIEAVVILVPLVLIYRQPDLGTAIILIVGVMAMLWVLGIPWQVVAGVIVVGAAYVAFALLTQDYHMDRIVTMLDPWADPLGDGYQSIQSFYALGSGGIFGTGLGLSHQKYLYLPYAHTDFIFAVIGEELGLVGTLFTVALYALFVVSGLYIMRNASDMHGASIAGGLVVMVGFQATVNMMCVSGIMPVTGKALPFISYGGSSLVASLAMVGLVLGVSLRSRLDAVHERRRDDLVVVEGGGKGRAGNAGLSERMGELGLSLIPGGKRTPERNVGASAMHGKATRAGSGGGRRGGTETTQKTQPLRTQVQKTQRMAHAAAHGKQAQGCRRSSSRGALQRTQRLRQTQQQTQRLAAGAEYADVEHSGRLSNSNAFRAGGSYAHKHHKPKRPTR